LCLYCNIVILYFNIINIGFSPKHFVHYLWGKVTFYTYIQCTFLDKTSEEKFYGKELSLGLWEELLLGRIVAEELYEEEFTGKNWEYTINAYDILYLSKKDSSKISKIHGFAFGFWFGFVIYVDIIKKRLCFII
jgi:hypothetical protein